MQVKNIMSSDVDTINVNAKIREAAKMMAHNNYGSIPVEADERLKGMITDRDIALKLAEKDFDLDKATVSDCMSQGIEYCFEDESIEDVGEKMAKTRYRRFPVLSRDKRLVGIVSLGDLSKAEKSRSTTHYALQNICE